MSEFIKVARVSDVADQCAKCVHVGEHRIAIYNLGGEFYATDDICTHAYASLSEGSVSGDEVVCPLHFATFNIRTGACTGPPATEDLRTYEVRVNGDDIEVAVA